jgi:large subunit ribosomal protein L24
VLRVLATKGTAIVEKVNFTKKHTKPNPGKNVKGGILERESPIHVAKLQVICPSCNEPSRLGSHRNEEGTAVRFCRNCKADLNK